MPTEWTGDDVLEVLVNPVYTGVGEYPRMVSDEMWVKAVSKIIQDIGAEKALATMLQELRKAFPAQGEEVPECG